MYCRSIQHVTTCKQHVPRRMGQYINRVSQVQRSMRAVDYFTMLFKCSCIFHSSWTIREVMKLDNYSQIVPPFTPHPTELTPDFWAPIIRKVGAFLVPKSFARSIERLVCLIRSPGYNKKVHVYQHVQNN